MKKIILLTISIIITIHIFGQDQSSIENGGYINLEEFKNNKAQFPDSFIVSKRTTADIKAWGGNDYQVESTSELITKKTIRKEIWGVYKNDKLYLNGMHIVKLIGYVEVEILGTYSFLQPSFPVNPKIQNELGLNDPQFGYMFGAMGGAIQGAKMATKRIPLIYNMKTGEKMLLAEANIAIIIVKYPDLKSEFDAEADKRDKEVLLKYLIKVNAVEK